MSTEASGTEVVEEIKIHLAELMARHGITNGPLAEAIGISPNQLSRLKNGDVSFIRLTTLLALCRELQCQPGDLLTYRVS